MQSSAQRSSPIHAGTLPAGSRRTTRAIATAAALCAVLGVARAVDPPKPTIRTCKDAQGRALITDASDPRCYQAPPTPDEIARIDEEQRVAMERYRECMAQQRSDQSLLSRYPNQVKHDAARKAALAEIEATLKVSNARLEQLLAERQRLRNEAEFYPNGNLPPKLKRDIDSNSALIAAQTEAIAAQNDSAALKTSFYDGELAKLKTLWAPQRGEPTRACVQPRIVKQPDPKR